MPGYEATAWFAIFAPAGTPAEVIKRHTKARRAGVQSGIIEREAPIHLSNVMLYDDKTGRGTRVGIRTLPDGTRERVSRASGETISKG